MMIQVGARNSALLKGSVKAVNFYPTNGPTSHRAHQEGIKHRRSALKYRLEDMLKVLNLIPTS